MDWPADLPFFAALQEMRRSGPQDAVLRSEMSIGPAKVRRRTSGAVSTRSGRIPFLTAEELATFETFFSESLAQGALAFTVTDPFDCAVRNCRFVGSYDVVRTGRGFSVSAELEFLP